MRVKNKEAAPRQLLKYKQEKRQNRQHILFYRRVAAEKKAAAEKAAAEKAAAEKAAAEKTDWIVTPGGNVGVRYISPDGKVKKHTDVFVCDGAKIQGKPCHIGNVLYLQIDTTAESKNNFDQMTKDAGRKLLLPLELMQQATPENPGRETYGIVHHRMTMTCSAFHTEAQLEKLKQGGCPMCGETKVELHAMTGTCFRCYATAMGYY